jgi:hypothetical protein
MESAGTKPRRAGIGLAGTYVPHGIDPDAQPAMFHVEH